MPAYRPLPDDSYDPVAPESLAIRLSLRPDTRVPSADYTAYDSIAASPVELRDGTPRNLGDLHPYCDLEAVAYVSNARVSDGRAYGALDIRLHATVYSVIDARRAARIARTLRTLATRMGRIAPDAQWSDGIGGILRAARAMGIGTFVTGEPGPDGTYSTGNWTILTPDQAAALLATWERDSMARMAAAPRVY